MKKHLKRRERTPNWFRIAVWGGMALFALILAWLIGTVGETSLEGMAG